MGFLFVSLVALLYFIIDVVLCIDIYKRSGNTSKFKLVVYMTVLVLVIGVVSLFKWIA